MIKILFLIPNLGHGGAEKDRLRLVHHRGDRRDRAADRRRGLLYAVL